MYSEMNLGIYMVSHGVERTLCPFVSYIDGSVLLWLQRLTFLSGVLVFRLWSLWVIREHHYEREVHVGRGQSTADGKNL
jgi:hypothetical protein